MMHARHGLVLAAFVLAWWGWASASWADWAMRPTPEELALLPPYCTHVQTGYGATPEGYARWKTIYGEAFHHYHHYCFAFIWLMRAERHSTPANLRSAYWSLAFDEIQYVVKRSPPDHPMLPEMLTKQGMIKRRLGKPEDGIPLLKKAAELNPQYWRAYLELALCHLAQNREGEARAVLQDGLTHTPDAKVLTALLDELARQQPRNAHRARK